MARRGGVLYKPPVGWIRFGLNIGDEHGPDRKWLQGKDGSKDSGEWAIAYHGTAMNILPLILENGFVVGPGQGAKDCQDNRTGNRVGEGVFCSPNLETCECYARGNEDSFAATKEMAKDHEVDGRVLLFVLQCRVKPDAIRRPNRNFAKCNDEEVMGIEGVFKWVINGKENIRPYGILVKELKKDDKHHGRSLGQLISNDAWNKEHKRKKLGEWDDVPGKDTDPRVLEQIKQSWSKAE